MKHIKVSEYYLIRSEVLGFFFFKMSHLIVPCVVHHES
jgi:hypothetical protein